MIVKTWTAVEVRALRVAALRMTREQLADVLGWGASTIQKWEHGATRSISGDRADALDKTLADLTPVQLERFTDALTEARATQGVHPGVTVATLAAEEEDDDMRRRTFGTLAVAAAATTLAPAARIGRADVARLEAISAQLESDLQRQGGAALVDGAVAALDYGLALVDGATFDGTTGRALMSAVGNLATQTGWLAYDADRHGLARRCFTEALSLAGTVDDDWLTANACLTAALQPVALARNGIGSASRALPLVARAADAMRRQAPSRIHALIATREAAAYGVMGDADGFGRAISTAWRELDRAELYEPVDDCPQWLRFVTPQEIRGHEARGCADVGRSRAALGLYEVAITEHASPSNAANMGAWAASARAQIGDLDGALAQALPVLKQLESAVTSPRTLKALTPVREALRAVPAAADFCARFDALDARGSVSA
ncbi:MULTISPECIES: helix-turn-helix domain-containing protein [Nocardia]|uniref:helix-turn-helix domain-containing protein n=1 Tax=Nocardia TaxID=1817 RepID=UPI000D69E667|nr:MULTISPECIES: helix-turn-helix transcriptional regulator [Nocardia]